MMWIAAANALLAVPAGAVATQPAPPENVKVLGASIQRTMTLLATSTPERRHRVKVLFYGQSVTRGAWSKMVADTLRKRFPHADLVIENRAIGGYTAPTLIHTAEYDLYPFYPDLVIFHVYGGVKGGEQEKIIRRIRERTTAEVLLWTSHFRWPLNLPRDGSPNDPAAKGLTEADEQRVAMIRRLADKYGCELAEVRERLRQYLKEHGLYPKDTLHDSVHPNKLGNFLIASLILPSLRHDLTFPKEPWQDLVQDMPADDERVNRGSDGSVELTFDGNRVDVVAAQTWQDKLGTAKVFIDGKPPSTYPNLYYHARPSAAPHTSWPAINRIDRQKPLLVETWTASILECDPVKNVLKYEVVGSETGRDGAGDHMAPFVSNSGRVVIDARRWMVCHALRYRKKPLPADYKVTWQVKPLFADVYLAPKTDDTSREYATTLAQGLTNGKHTLRIVPNGDGPVPIQAIRVYRPPLR